MTRSKREGTNTALTGFDASSMNYVHRYYSSSETHELGFVRTSDPSQAYIFRDLPLPQHQFRLFCWR